MPYFRLVVTPGDLTALDPIATQLEDPDVSETKRTTFLESGRSITARYSCAPHIADEAAETLFKECHEHR